MDAVSIDDQRENDFVKGFMKKNKIKALWTSGACFASSEKEFQYKHHPLSKKVEVVISPDAMAPSKETSS